MNKRKFKVGRKALRFALLGLLVAGMAASGLARYSGTRSRSDTSLSSNASAPALPVSSGPLQRGTSAEEETRRRLGELAERRSRGASTFPWEQSDTKGAARRSLAERLEKAPAAPGDR